MQRLWCLLLLLLPVVFAQTPGQAIWEPPDWNFPQEAEATVPKEMLESLRISAVSITLEKTKLDKVEQLVGGEIGAKGDAGEAVQWLCLHGTAGVIGFSGLKAEKSTVAMSVAFNGN